jgi:hypothetical protein
MARLVIHADGDIGVMDAGNGLKARMGRQQRGDGGLVAIE